MILEWKEVQLSCNIKGIDILIPDNTNYDASKFIMLQTGNIIVKNGPSNNQSFTIRKQFAELITQ